MAEQDFLVYDPNSVNIETQTNYIADANRLNGISSGIMSSMLYNKSMRQASVIASMIAQFIVAQTGDNVIDDGTTATILANFITALRNTPQTGGGIYLTTASTSPWTVPANVASVWAEVWSGGGGSIGGNGGSGGSGAYSAGWVTVPPGGTMAFTVGLGGLGSASQSDPVIAGGSSTFGPITCTGGNNGGGGGGAGGVASGGLLNINGRVGQDLDGSLVDARGGDAPRGGGGGTVNSAGSGTAPSVPGGGAGAAAGSGAFNQAGANGAIMLTW